MTVGELRAKLAHFGDEQTVVVAHAFAPWAFPGRILGFPPKVAPGFFRKTDDGQTNRLWDDDDSDLQGAEVVVIWP